MSTDHSSIPEGMSSDAASNWPPQELINDFLGNAHAVEMWPGETIEVDSAEAEAQMRLYRDVLGRYCSGVTVVTATADGAPVGMTCQSFCAISLDPPLVMFSPMKTSRAWPLMRKSGKFCVNFLAADQIDVSNVMASKGADKFADVAWSQAATGSPLLEGVVGYVDCTIHAVHDAGDHYIVLGKVVDMAVTEQQAPLLYHQGKYRTSQDV